MFRRVPLCVLFVLLLTTAADAQPPTDLLVAPHDAPKYRLSNFRVEDGRFGRPVLRFDYRRTSEGKGRVQIAGRSVDGPLRITFSHDVNKAQGEVALEKSMSGFGDGGYNFEFYFVMPARWAGRNYGNCLVSNSVTMGNPGRGPSPRAWTAEEQAAYDKQQLADKTPDSAPAGYELLGPSAPLVPGMPVKASRYAEWVDAEILTEAPKNQVTILYRGDERATTIDRDGWLAAEASVLSRAQQSPSSFTPSMRVLPGGSVEMPRGAAPLDPDLVCPRGMPLLLERGWRFEKVYVLEDEGSSIRVRYDDSSFEFPHKRSELAVSADTLRQLLQPGGAEKFANDLNTGAHHAEELDDDEAIVGAHEAFGKHRGKKMHVFDKDYDIDSSIPRGAQVVPEGVELPEGTPLAYNWARRWEKCFVVADEGYRILVLEEDHPVFVWRIDRDQLIIQNKTLRKIERASVPKLADLQNTLRTWTDASGQHKVEARFVRRSADKVTLRTDAGREISLPIAKLCDDDQELLSKVESAEAVANPFE